MKTQILAAALAVAATTIVTLAATPALAAGQQIQTSWSHSALPGA